MDSLDDCSLYAELLVNIRQISLAASLPSPSDISTQVALSADGRTVRLSHRGQVCQLTLPAKVALGGTLLPVQDQQKGATGLSWRLPLDASSIPSLAHQPDSPPWSAMDLRPNSEVACRQCNTVVVPGDAVKVWKDLPSENWAEMMEFWHCHKPDHGKDSGKADENTLSTRGYGASSAITAQKGVGFVDLTTLLFAESDCRNIMVSCLLLPSVSSTWWILSGSSLVIENTEHEGIKKVAKPAFRPRWRGYRYKCPRSTYWHMSLPAQATG
jgi:hypothetical protein